MKKPIILFVLLAIFALLTAFGYPTVVPPKWHYDSSGNLTPIKTGVTVSVAGTATLPNAVIGSLAFTADSGAVEAMDMPVSATPADGVEESYAFRIDNNPVLKVYGEADSAGGADTFKLTTWGQITNFAIINNTVLGTLEFYGDDDTASADAVAGQIQVIATGTWTDGAEDAKMVLNAVNDGTLNANQLVLNTDGSVSHKTKTYTLAELSDAACATAATTCDITAIETNDTTINTYGWDGANDCNMVLPAGADGLKVTFIMGVTDAAEDFYIDVTDNGIYLNGTAIGDGERVWTQEPTIAEMIVCQTFTIDGSTWDWVCNSVVGVWADKGS